MCPAVPLPRVVTTCSTGPEIVPGSGPLCVIFYGFSVAYRTHGPVGRNVSEIYAYEVPSETHWNFHSVEPGFQPNVWVDIGPHLETKLKALACFESQLRPFPDARSMDAVEAMARFRGSQMNMHAAEAFVTVRKLRGAL